MTKQTKLIIKEAIEAQKIIIDSFNSTRNPIEHETKLRAQARLEVLEAVEQSLNGNHTLLRCYL